MAIKSLNIAATKKYVSESDPDYDKEGNHGPTATKWKIGSMDSYIQSYIKEKSQSYVIGGKDISEEELDMEDSKKISVKVNLQTVALESCRLCLRGWDNFIDHNGNQIEFKTKNYTIAGRKYEGVHPDSLALLPSDMQTELYTQIELLSSFSEEEAKNFVEG